MNLVSWGNQSAPYKTKTKAELITILNDNGYKNTEQLGNCLFGVNEYGIIEGIGIHFTGELKVWNNRSFGVFEE